MKIAIIGAGFTGLTAAWRLSQKGHEITVFEKEKTAGGLAAGFKPALPAGRETDWQWYLENFYHHVFTSDTAFQKIVAELNLSDKLFFEKPKTSIFYQGKIARFDSSFSLLTFPHLNFIEKIRAGLVTLYLKLLNDWQPLEKVTAYTWLKKYYGYNTFKILWQPLIASKFAKQAKKISMVWFWARIKKRSTKLGYMEGGFQVLTDKLLEKIKEKGGRVLLGCEIVCFDDLNKFDRIIFTVSASTFLKMAPKLPKEYQEKLGKLEMIGAITLILVLKEKFLKDGTYWLNINEQGFPFVAVVEHTNFVDKKYYGNGHILYVGGYYPQNHRYFKMNKDQILKEFLPYLQKINPQFHQSSIINHQSSISLYAQPAIPLNYSQIVPSHQSPIPNVYLANIQQVYPWDRGINYAIEEGEKIANEV